MNNEFKIHKFLDTLPDTLEPNALYLVKGGSEFDLYCSDNAGNVAHKINGVSSNELLNFIQSHSTTKLVNSNGDFTHFANIVGDSLSAGCSFFLFGSSNTDVVCVQGSILVNRNNSIVVKSTSGNNTQVEFKVSSNGSESFAIEVKSLNAFTSANLTLVLMPYHNETVDFVSSISYNVINLHQTIPNGTNTTCANNLLPNIKIAGNTIWHTGNDGPGSGLDADFLDGKQSVEFATSLQGALADTAVQPSAIVNFETTTQLNNRDIANRDRANHTGTQLVSSISDFVSASQAIIDSTAFVFEGGDSSTNFYSITLDMGASA